MWQDKYIQQVKSDPTLIGNVDSPALVNRDGLHGFVYDVAMVHKLTGEENGMKHNIYVDVLNRFGEPYRSIKVLFRNNNLPDQLVTLDKPLNEPGGNVPIFPDDLYQVRVFGDKPSAIVGNLHVRLPDEPGEGNRLYHHSYYIVFIERVVGQTITPPVTPEIPVGVTDDVKLELQDIVRQQLLLTKRLEQVAGKIK